MDPENIYKKPVNMLQQVHERLGIRQDAGVPENVEKFAWPRKPHSGRAFGEKSQSKGQAKPGRGRGAGRSKAGRGAKRAFGTWGGFSD